MGPGLRRDDVSRKSKRSLSGFAPSPVSPGGSTPTEAARPYLLLQGLPLVLIPLWQAIHRAPRAERIAFAAAMMLYVLAKLAEVLDHEIANALGFVSGHTLKHLIATTATAAVVWGVTQRFTARELQRR